MNCTKKSYRDKNEALQGLRYIQVIDDGRKKPIRTYECTYCNKWYLTSKEKLNNSDSIKPIITKTSSVRELLSLYNINLNKKEIEFYIKRYNNYEMCIKDRINFILADKSGCNKFVNWYNLNKI